MTILNRSSYLYCLSNPKTLIRGGVLRVGPDPVPAVKLLPDPAGSLASKAGMPLTI